jgi:hypothetical protein
MISKNLRAVGLLLLLILARGLSASATTYNITSTTDGTGLNQLRGALLNADQSAGPHTINLPAGTYNITLGTITFGSIAQTISIVGAGAGSTIINMAGAGSSRDRIFLINTTGTIANVSTSISGVKFTNGYLTSDIYGGGAILAGGPYNTLTLTACEFSNNSFGASGGTTGGAVNISGGGTVTVSSCVFTSNSNPSNDGGALYFFLGATNGSPGSFTVSGCTFTGNTAGGSGGAIGVSAGGANTFSCSIVRNIFLNNVSSNSTAGGGGAISITNVSAAGNTSFINYNRFYGNTATATNSSRSAVSVGTGTQGNVDLSNNWWGCNNGAGTSGCADKAAVIVTGGGGTYTFSPYLQLKTSIASAACSGTSTTATVGFTSNSSGSAISSSNLTALSGTAVTFSAAKGALSNGQTTIQSSGTATVTLALTGSVPDTVRPVVDAVTNTDATARGIITVNAVAGISSQPQATSVCTGASTSFSVSATGSGVLSYQWRKGTTNLANGTTGNGSTLAGATSSSLTISGATASDAASNYNVVVTSSLCGSATSSDVALTVNTPPAIAAAGQPSSATPCPGAIASFTVAATGTAPLSYQWYKGTTALTNGSTGTGSTIAGATSATLNIAVVSASDNAANYNVKVTNSCSSTGVLSNQVALTTNTAPGVSIAASTAVCLGNIATITATVTGTAPFTYQWRKGTTNLTDGATGNGSTISGATSGTLTITNAVATDAASNYNVVVSNTCPAQATSGNGSLVITPTGTWLGGTSTAWSNTANWSCGTVPTSTIDVTIPAGTTYSPLIDVTNAVANNIVIASGASLGFSASANGITVNGSISGSGTFNTSGGKTSFTGSSQTIPALTYQSLQITGGGSKTLAGAITVTGVLTLGSGYVLLGGNDLTIGSSGSISGGSSASFVVVSGTGGLIQQGIGTGGRTGAVSFPIGISTTSYTPLQLDNSSGTADNFTARVINHTYSAYDAGDNNTGTAFSSNIVDRTWLLKEAVAGGSNATVTFQWNSGDELSGFTRSSCKVSHYVSGAWVANSVSAPAGGSNPYTQSMTGVTSFSPFGVGSGAANPLPLALLEFKGRFLQQDAELTWSMAQESSLSSFTIERSVDGLVYIPIGTLPATANNTQRSEYSWADEKPAGAELYYRLKGLDRGGQMWYSGTVILRRPLTPEPFNVYPNPVTGSDLFIRNSGSSAGETQILIRDIGGRIRGSHFFPESATASGTVRISLATLPAGTYLVECRNALGSAVTKIVKQ